VFRVEGKVKVAGSFGSLSQREQGEKFYKRRGLTFSPTTKIFNPKIDAYPRTCEDMIFSRLPQLPKWNRPFSYPI